MRSPLIFFNKNLITRSIHRGAKNPLPLDKQHIDPRARVNNDAQHVEIVSNKCSNPDCNNRICPEPCGKIEEKKSEGHFTHNGNFQGPGKVNVRLSDTDFKGHKKTQFAAKYEKSHITDDNQSINEKAAEFLKKDPNALQNFIQADINKKDKK